MLLVSMLDGQVVALKLGIPDELGNLLRPEEQSRVFQLRYGIDLNDTDMGRRRLFVGENSGPKLIENALQYFLEDQEEGDNDEDDDKFGSWRRRKQLFVAEATSIVSDARHNASCYDGDDYNVRCLTALGWRPRQTARSRRTPTPVRPRTPQRRITLPQSRVTWPLDPRRGQFSDRPAMDSKHDACFMFVFV